LNYVNCTKKYNPKVYMGAIQSVAKNWNIDTQNAQNYPAADLEKSGSWPNLYQASGQKTTANTDALYGTEQFYGGESNCGYRVRKSISTNMVTYYDQASNSWQFLIDNLYEYDYNI